MPYSVKAVANEFLAIGFQSGDTITQMKLQKLVYIAHGWNLAIFNEPLINDQIQAWKHGPVIPVLYNEFRGVGSSNITEYATDISVDEESFNILYETPRIATAEENTHLLIQKIWNKYGHLSGPQLSSLTHMPNTPWSDIYRSNQHNLPISNEIIKSHYNDLLRR
ncbi:MAG: type II toxin-antitoxin system antitoxin SocA domain-containing protein [Sulfurimonas sp.]|jgi:uncharacterized phage-associated protein